MKDKWHWLRHKWTKWTPYQMNYHDFSSNVRQWRTCQTCGTLQDELVNVNAKLHLEAVLEWQRLPEPMPKSE